jgi:cell division protease FtsH
MPLQIKSVAFWIVIVVFVVMLWELTRTGQHPAQQSAEISYSQFLSQVDAGNVASVLISDNRIEGKYHNSESFAVNGPTNQDAMIQILRQKNVDIRFTENHPSGPASVLLTWAPLVVLAVLWFLMIRQMKQRRQAAVQTNAQNTSSQIDNRWSSK